MKLIKTSRGFAIAEFRDHNGESCSIQESSVATEDLIWLGRDDVDSHTFGRMHLTQAMVAELLPLLTRFAETGRLAEDTD